MLRGAPALDALYVPIGLGSGICGAIFTRDLLGLRTEIIGVQSTGADCYAQSLAAGHVVVLNRSDTLADGMAVRQPDAEAFEIIRRGVARSCAYRIPRSVMLSGHIGRTRIIWSKVPGAAPLAALLQERQTMAGKRVGLVVSGGNIDLELFRQSMRNFYCAFRSVPYLSRKSSCILPLLCARSVSREEAPGGAVSRAPNAVSRIAA